MTSLDATAVDLDALTEIVGKQVPILGAMGIKVLVAERGRAEALLPIAENRNHVGIAYAGSLFSVAEVLGGLLAMTSLPLEGFAPVVKSFQVKYSRPAFGDVRAVASLTDPEIEAVLSTASAVGKADFVIHANVLDEAGGTVASTEGVYQLRDFSGM